MNDYLIYTDSAVDLPAHVYQDYQLGIVPMSYSLDGEEKLFDTGSPAHNEECDAFFAALKNGADSKTTQVNEFSYIELFGPLLAEGKDVLYICFSSGLSGTFNSACMAATELREEYPDRQLVVVDSLAATVGQGIFVRAALINRENGMSLEDNAAWLKVNCKYLRHEFMVGDLHYLHKGGRVSAAVAVVGSMLKVKPILIIDDEGKLQVVAKARGLKGAFKKLIEGYVKDLGVPGVPKIVHIVHTSMYEEAEELKRQAEEILEEGATVDIINMGPIIGTHTGPELIGLCSWGFQRKSS